MQKVAETQYSPSPFRRDVSTSHGPDLSPFMSHSRINSEDKVFLQNGQTVKKNKNKNKINQSIVQERSKGYMLKRSRKSSQTQSLAARSLDKKSIDKRSLDRKRAMVDHSIDSSSKLESINFHDTVTKPMYPETDEI